MDSSSEKIQFLPHHKQQSLCTTRPPYRQGRKLTAVKVYTVNDESVHLLIHGVPSIGLEVEVSSLCERYGRLKSIKLVEKHSFDQEEFTNVFHAQFERIQSARFAKKILDNREFFGGVLHVCYAPELETINETKLKLVNRKREIAKRTKNASKDHFKNKSQMSDTDEGAFKALYQEKFSLGNSISSNSETDLSHSSDHFPVPPPALPVNDDSSSSIYCELVRDSSDDPFALTCLEASKDCSLAKNSPRNYATFHGISEQTYENLKLSSTEFRSVSSKVVTTSISQQAVQQLTFNKFKTASSSSQSSALDTSALGPPQTTFKKFKSSTSHHGHHILDPYHSSSVVLQQSYKKYGSSCTTQQHSSSSQETSLSALPSTSQSQKQELTTKTSATGVSEGAPNPLKRRIFETKFLPRSLAIKKKKE